MKLRKALERAKQERGDDFIRTEKIESFENAPVFSQSRRVDLDEQVLKNNLCIAYFSGTPEVDHYKAIRTQIIQRMKKNDWKTLVISSAFPREGKSLSTINLALAFAKELHQKVLLVDADLRNQSIHKYLGYKSSVGLASFLAGDVTLQEVLVWPGIENLSVISGGESVRDSTELLTSTKMRAAINEMRDRYNDRIIIFDSPPILTTPDTAAFIPFVDAVVMIVKADATSVENITKARKLIPDEKFVGFVLNQIKQLNMKSDFSSYY